MDYIVYHQVKRGFPCADGSAASWVAYKAYPNAQICGAVYGEPLCFTPQSGDHLIIVDFSFPAAEIEKWIEDGVTVTLIDHHKTAQENLGQFLTLSLEEQVGENRFVFNMDECGATLTWKYFFPDKPAPEFLNYIRDRDLWKHELPNTAEVHEALGKLGRSFELYDRLEPMRLEELLAYLVPIGNEALKARQAAVEKAVKRVQFGEVGGYSNIPYVALAPDGSEDYLTSDICAALYRKYPEALFSAALLPGGKWSLRSDSKGNNTDVSTIAKKFGGGGHFNAAGYTTTEVLAASN